MDDGHGIGHQSNDKFDKAGKARCFMRAAVDKNVGISAKRESWAKKSFLVPGILASILKLVGRVALKPQFDLGLDEFQSTIGCGAICSLVCKHWKHVCTDELVVKLIDLSPIEACDTVNDEMLSSALQLFKSVEGIDLSAGQSCCGCVVTDNGIENLVARCAGNLVKVNISMCHQLTYATLEHLALCPVLENLAIEGDEWKPKFTAEAFARFLSKSPSLTALDIGNFDSDEILDALSSSRNILRLGIKNSNFSDEKLGKVASACRHLQSLDATNALSYVPQQNGSHVNATAITGTGMANLVQMCPGLTELNLSSTLITNDALAHIAKLGNLKSLTLSKTRSSCDYKWSDTFNGFTEITDNGIVRICEGCKCLSYLDLSACYNLSDAALLSVATLQNLTSFIIARRVWYNTYGDKNHLQEIPDGCFATITSAGLVAIAGSCRLLETLDISFFGDVIDDAVLDTVAASLTHIKCLKLGACGAQLTTRGFQGLAKHCKSLSVLHFYFKPPFSDKKFCDCVLSHFGSHVNFPYQFRYSSGAHGNGYPDRAYGAFLFYKLRHTRAVFDHCN